MKTITLSLIMLFTFGCAAGYGVNLGPIELKAGASKEDVFANASLNVRSMIDWVCNLAPIIPGCGEDEPI